MSRVATGRPGASHTPARRRSRAFTLIELIVVVIIIAVLAAVAAVAYNQYASRARSNAVLASASDVRTALMAAAARDGHTAADEAALLWDQAGKDSATFLTALSAHYDGAVTFSASTDSEPAALQVGSAGSGSHAACLVLSEPPAVHAGGCADPADPGGPATPTQSETPTPPVNAYADLVTADGASAYWPMDDATGSSTLADPVGGNVATVAAGGFTASVAGLADDGGTAAKFAGSYYTVPDTAAVRPSAANAFTYEVWLNPAGTGQMGILEQYAGGGSTRGTYFRFASDGRVMLGSTVGNIGTALALATPQPLPQNAISYVVATYDGGVAKLYVNGTLVASQSVAVTFSDPGVPLVIGNRSDVRSMPFVGVMDDVAIYPTALSAAQVAAHYAAAS